MKTNFFKVIFRRLRLIRFDRNFLVFLIFLLVSVAFWFLQTLKEDMSVSITYNFTITDIPKDVIITSKVPEEIKINLTGHGWNIVQNMMRNEKRSLEVSFKDLNKSNGMITIDQSVFQRIASKKLSKDLHYVSTIPNRLELYYSNGKRKRVPIIFNGNIKTAENRIQCGIIFSSDSVDVYAPENILKDINSISTVKSDFVDLDDTLECKIPLDIPVGAKIIPDSIKTTICVDLFTEKTISVPIFSENTPNNKIIRTFPLQTKLTFLVSSTLYDKITENDFLVIIDYMDLDFKDNKCRLQLRVSPEGVRNIRMSPEAVEYVIEQQTE